MLADQSPQEVIDLASGVFEVLKRSIYNKEPGKVVGPGEYWLPRAEAVALFEKAITAIDFFEPILAVGEEAMNLICQRQTWWVRIFLLGRIRRVCVDKELKSMRNCREAFRDCLGQVMLQPEAKRVGIEGKVLGSASDWVQSYESEMRFHKNDGPYR